MSLGDQIELLRRSDSPVTFLDMLRLVQRAKHVGSDELQALLALYDDRSITDGAREVLGDFLKGRAHELAHERLSAGKVLTLADSGKTVRTRKDARLQLKLETRAHRGGAWELTSANKAVAWEPKGLDKDRRYTLGELLFKEPGRVSVELVEVLAPPKKSHARSQRPADEARHFKLDLIIEAEPPTRRR